MHGMLLLLATYYSGAGGFQILDTQNSVIPLEIGRGTGVFYICSAWTAAIPWAFGRQDGRIPNYPWAERHYSGGIREGIWMIEIPDCWNPLIPQKFLWEMEDIKLLIPKMPLFHGDLEGELEVSQFLTPEMLSFHGNLFGIGEGV